eukprot:6350060-Prymnesium_polylepis.1
MVPCDFERSEEQMGREVVFSVSRLNFVPGWRASHRGRTGHGGDGHGVCACRARGAVGVLPFFI